MSRLTYKLNEQEQEEHKTKYLKFEYFPIPDYCIEKGNYGRITSDMIYNKLGKLEDIEEQLGCPLEVLKPNQKVEFIRDNETLCADVMGVNIQTKKIMIGSAWSFTELPLNQFNKTWWLRKDKSE